MADENEIEFVATEIVDASVRVHKELGPGLMESAYQACLTYELRGRGFQVEREVPMPVRYGRMDIETGYRIDMIVD